MKKKREGKGGRPQRAAWTALAEQPGHPGLAVASSYHRSLKYTTQPSTYTLTNRTTASSYNDWDRITIHQEDPTNALSFHFLCLSLAAPPSNAAIYN